MMDDGNNYFWFLIIFFFQWSNEICVSRIDSCPMDNTNRPPSQKSPRARLHRRNKSHGTYIIRWARGRVTMSSSEKVSEKPRENDKPPAYPVTRRRVTHFFFFSFFFPLPLFILHFLPPSTACPSSSSGLTPIAVCESPSAVFHPPPHFYTFIRRCEKDWKR